MLVANHSHFSDFFYLLKPLKQRLAYVLETKRVRKGRGLLPKRRLLLRPGPGLNNRRRLGSAPSRLFSRSKLHIPFIRLYRNRLL